MMIKCLIKVTSKITGMHVGIKGEVSINLRGDMSDLSGDVSGLSGDVTGLIGDVSGLRGYVSGLRGDVTGLSGYVSGLRGDVSEDTLTPDERKKGVDIRELIKAD